MTSSMSKLMMMLLIILGATVLLIGLKVSSLEKRLDDHIQNHKVDQSLTYNTLDPEEGG